MSEEQNLNAEEQELTPTQKMNYFSLLSLMFSIAAMILSVVTFLNVNEGKFGAPQGAPGQVVISRQYDKGKTYEKAQAKNKPMIVFFYTDWCGFCQRFAPTFNKVEKNRNIKKKFAIAYVNCEEERNREVVEEYQIKGFPSVFVVDKDGKRTQLENGTFFNPDSVEVVTKNALDLIDED